MRLVTFTLLMFIIVKTHRAIQTFESGVHVAPEDFTKEQWIESTERYILEACELTDTKWLNILHAVEPFVEKLMGATKKGKKKASRVDLKGRLPPRATMPRSSPLPK